MFGLFKESLPCPCCTSRIAASTVKVNTEMQLKVFTCPDCKANYVKNKRSELFRVLEEGAVLC